MSLFQELQRRNVFRVGAAYIVTAWLVVQVVETLFPVFDLGNQSPGLPPMPMNERSWNVCADTSPDRRCPRNDYQ